MNSVFRYAKQPLKRFVISALGRAPYRDEESDLAQLVDVPIGDCLDVLGRSYSSTGRNHWVEFLAEYSKQNHFLKEESSLHKYYKEFRFSDAMKVLFPSTHLDKTPDLIDPSREIIFPWSYLTKVQQFSSDGSRSPSKVVSPSDYWGPKTSSEIARECKRTVDIYNNIRSSGYRPEFFKDKYGLSPYPWGVILKYGEQHRFVILSGKHKISALSVMGATSVLVKPRPHAIASKDTYPLIVDYANARNWPCVQYGIYSEQQAKEFLAVYFSVSRI